MALSNFSPARSVESRRLDSSKWFGKVELMRATREKATARQRKLWTKYRLNDRFDRVEGRTQRAVEAVPLGHESR